MRLTTVLLVSLLLLNSCKKETGILEKKQFVDVLVDLHIYDAVSTDYSLSAQFLAIDSTVLYRSILAHHNTNRAEFDATLDWYAEHPKRFNEVYDEVFGSVERINNDLSEKNKLFTGKNTDVVWVDKKHKHFIGDTITYPEPYVIDLKGVGTYLFDIKIRILKQDLSESPSLHIYLYKDKADANAEDRLLVARTTLIKTNYSRDFQYVFDLAEEEYKYAKIIIPETVDRGAGKNKNLQITKMRVLKVKEEEIAEEEAGTEEAETATKEVDADSKDKPKAVVKKK